MLIIYWHYSRFSFSNQTSAQTTQKFLRP